MAVVKSVGQSCARWHRLTAKLQCITLKSTCPEVLCARKHTHPPDASPVLEAYHSAIAFAKKPSFMQHVVTKEEYLESGSNATRRKFRDWKPADPDGKQSEAHKGRTAAKTYQEDAEEDDVHPPKTSTRGRGRGRPPGTTRGGRGGRRRAARGSA